MIRTNVVTLTVIKAIAYRQKLMSGGSGIVILRDDVAQPGLASISKTSGEAIPAANNPPQKYPDEAFKEAMELTAGLPYRKQGSVKLKGEIFVKEEPEKEAEPEEIVVDSAEYLKIVEKYTDKNDKLSYDLLNKDMIKFMHSSSIAREMISENEDPDKICLYVVGTKFRKITGNRELSDEQIMKMVELLDEVSPKGVLTQFNKEIRRSLQKNK